MWKHQRPRREQHLCFASDRAARRQNEKRKAFSTAKNAFSVILLSCTINMLPSAAAAASGKVSSAAAMILWSMINFLSLSLTPSPSSPSLRSLVRRSSRSQFSIRASLMMWSHWTQCVSCYSGSAVAVILLPVAPEQRLLANMHVPSLLLRLLCD